MDIAQTLKGLAKRAGDKVADVLGGEEEQQGELFGLGFHLENVRKRVSEAKTAEEKLKALMTESERLRAWYFDQKTTTDGAKKASEKELNDIAVSYTDTKDQIGAQLDLVQQAKANTEESVTALDTAANLAEAQGQTLPPEVSAQVAAARAASLEAKTIAREIEQLISEDVHTTKINDALAAARMRSGSLVQTPVEQAKAEVTRTARKGIESDLDYLFSTMPKVDIANAAETVPEVKSEPGATPEQK